MKRFFRPSHKCLYVIPDLSGNYNSLEILLNRIIPLRKYSNQKDEVVFLGGYCGKNINGAQIIETLIALTQEYKNRVICLKGIQEELILKSILGSEKDYQYWKDECDGSSTINGYLTKLQLSNNPYGLSWSRWKEIFPKEHLNFLQSLQVSLIKDDYCFFYGGIAKDKSVEETSDNTLIFDYTTSLYVKKSLQNKEIPHFQDDYVYVSNNNYQEHKPFIYPKYMMLGGMAPKKILVLELNSMKACAVSEGKSRLCQYKLEIKE